MVFYGCEILHQKDGWKMLKPYHQWIGLREFFNRKTPILTGKIDGFRRVSGSDFPQQNQSIGYQDRDVYPLVNIQKAIENGPVEIVDFPMNNGGSFHSKLWTFTRGYHRFQRVNPFSNGPGGSPNACHDLRHSHLGRSCWCDHQLLTRPLGWEAMTGAF